MRLDASGIHASMCMGVSGVGVSPISSALAMCTWPAVRCDCV
jgi:hypothetical protein